ncbi:MAG: hypothetical protein F6K14_08655 [Symploca sp. SIO2C1]|nr:hypothetical protein [Symploca sp. SIO2C1]
MRKISIILAGLGLLGIGISTYASHLENDRVQLEAELSEASIKAITSIEKITQHTLPCVSTSSNISEKLGWIKANSKNDYSDFFYYVEDNHYKHDFEQLVLAYMDNKNIYTIKEERIEEKNLEDYFISEQKFNGEVYIPIITEPKPKYFSDYNFDDFYGKNCFYPKDSLAVDLLDFSKNELPEYKISIIFINDGYLRFIDENCIKIPGEDNAYANHSSKYVSVGSPLAEKDENSIIQHLAFSVNAIRNLNENRDDNTDCHNIFGYSINRIFHKSGESLKITNFFYDNQYYFATLFEGGFVVILQKRIPEFSIINYFSNTAIYYPFFQKKLSSLWFKITAWTLLIFSAFLIYRNYRKTSASKLKHKRKISKLSQEIIKIRGVARNVDIRDHSYTSGSSSGYMYYSSGSTSTNYKCYLNFRLEISDQDGGLDYRGIRLEGDEPFSNLHDGDQVLVGFVNGRPIGVYNRTTSLCVYCKKYCINKL